MHPLESQECINNFIYLSLILLLSWYYFCVFIDICKSKVTNVKCIIMLCWTTHLAPLCQRLQIGQKLFNLKETLQCQDSFLSHFTKLNKPMKETQAINQFYSLRVSELQSEKEASLPWLQQNYFSHKFDLTNKEARQL